MRPAKHHKMNGREGQKQMAISSGQIQKKEVREITKTKQDYFVEEYREGKEDELFSPMSEIIREPWEKASNFFQYMPEEQMGKKKTGSAFRSEISGEKAKKVEKDVIEKIFKLRKGE